VDTSLKFQRLQRFLGSAILLLGLHAHPPCVPCLPVGEDYKWTFVLAGKNDMVNLFLLLPEQSLDGMSHHTHHQGIDFMYDPSVPKPEGCLLLWFRKSDLSDLVVRQILFVLSIVQFTWVSSRRIFNLDKTELSAK
jgi:hypothetical protein